MDTLVQALPDRPRLALYLLRCAAMLAVLGLLFAKGIELTSRMASIDYPAMGISRGFLYAALPTTIPCSPTISSVPRAAPWPGGARNRPPDRRDCSSSSWASPSPSRCC